MSINREREGCTDEVGGWREGWRYEWPENNGMAGKDGWTEGVLGMGGGPGGSRKMEAAREGGRAGSMIDD